MTNAIHNWTEKMMNTINGKLIFMNASEIDEVKQKIEQLDRKLEQMEALTAIEGNSSINESLQQLNAIGLSVHQLRQFYRRLLWAIVAASVGLTLVNFLGFRHPSCAIRASENADSMTVFDDR